MAFISQVKLLDSIYSPMPARSAWRLDEWLEAGELRYYGLGRLALADAFRAAGLRLKDVVLFPGCICKEALQGVSTIGATAAFFPVTPGLIPAEDPSTWPAAKAVVAVNYFGFPQDLAPFKAYAARTGAALIEDNAHGFLSRLPDGTRLGLRADLGVFSPRKTFVLPNGGLLAAPQGGRYALPQAGAFQAGVPASFRAKQALRASVAKLGRKPVRAMQKLTRRVRPESEDGLAAGAHAPTQLLAQPITVADPSSEVDRRRQLYAWADGKVRELGGEPVYPELPEGVSPYVYAFRAKTAELERIRAALDAESVDVFQWPALPAEVEASAPPHYRDIHCVRFLW